MILQLFLNTQNLGCLKFDGCPKNGVCKKAPLRIYLQRGF